MNEFYVYAHVRPGSGRVFYVGKGKGRRAHSFQDRNPFWRSVVAKSGDPEVAFIARGLDEELAFLVEIESIDAYRRDGVKLANLTDGGEGVSGYRNPKGAPNKGVPCPEEMKARISATNKRKGVLPPIGWNRGKKTPQEVIERRRPALVASWERAKAEGTRVVTAETKAKQRAAKLGMPLGEEHRRNISKALRESPNRNPVPSFKGRRHSAESREKMSERSKGRKSKSARPVRCLDSGEVFESASAAAARFGRKEHTLIAACCRGAAPSAYGHHFEYVKEPSSV